MTTKTEERCFLFEVLARYDSRVTGNENALTVNVAAGPRGRLVHCGTLTMSEPEWNALIGSLKRDLRGAVDVVDSPPARP